MNVQDVLHVLKSKARTEDLEGMARFGMSTQQRLGVRVPEMRKLAKSIGRNHDLAMQLWKTGIAEARILASMIADPHLLTEAQMDAWAEDFDSWDVCDQACMNLFDKSPYAGNRIRAWAAREEEFVKRAAFALLACLAWHDKKAEDQVFLNFFPVIKAGASDERNFVKKAVSWTLRHIGKRRLSLNGPAIALAKEIQQIDSKAARWIASDVIRELESEAVQKRLIEKE